MIRKKIKVLHIIMSMDIGGIETFIMNIYRNIDREAYEFNFLLWNDNKSFYEDEIINMGGKIHKFKFSKNPIKNIKFLTEFLKNKDFEVVHCHSHFYSGFFALAAKKARVSNIICHMHSFSDNKKNNFIRYIYKTVCTKLMIKNSNYCCACSEEAAEYGFGKKSKYIIIKNYIETDKFITRNESEIDKIKKQYKIKETDIVLGHIGRFSIEKNHEFIINIIEKLIQEKKNIKCLLIGDGPEKNRIEELVISKKLQNYIFFVGEVDNVQDYLHTMNIFLFPSLYEGFGMALVEAQASGCYCISSDQVPITTDMGIDLVKYIPINQNNIKSWIDELKNNKPKELNNQIIKNAIIKNGFDVKNSVETIEKVYRNNYIGGQK